MKYSASVFNGARDICYIVLPLSYLHNACQNEGFQNERSTRHPKTETKTKSHLFFLYKQLTQNNSNWGGFLRSEAHHEQRSSSALDKLRRFDRSN